MNPKKIRKIVKMLRFWPYLHPSWHISTHPQSKHTPSNFLWLRHCRNISDPTDPARSRTEALLDSVWSLRMPITEDALGHLCLRYKAMIDIIDVVGLRPASGAPPPPPADGPSSSSAGSASSWSRCRVKVWWFSLLLSYLLCVFYRDLCNFAFQVSSKVVSL
jgi:hypothetical protein